MPVLMPRLWLWLCFRVYCTGLPALVPSMRPSFVPMHVFLSSLFLSALCLLLLLLLPSHCFIFLPYRHPSRLQASSFFGGPMLTQSVCGCGRVRQAKKKRGSSKRPVDDKPAMDARFFPRPSTFPLHAQLNTSPPAASYYLLESHVNDPRSVSSHAQLATGTGGNFSANFVQRGGNREVPRFAASCNTSLPVCSCLLHSSSQPLSRTFIFASLAFCLLLSAVHDAYGYSREHVYGNMQVREAAAGQAPNAGSIEGGGGGGKRTELSSDDLVMERFKKRFCMKK